MSLPTDETEADSNRNVSGPIIRDFSMPDLSDSMDSPKLSAQTLQPSERLSPSCQQIHASSILEDPATFRLVVRSCMADKQLAPVIFDHRCNGVALTPAGLYADMAQTAAAFLWRKFNEQKAGSMTGVTKGKNIDDDEAACYPGICISDFQVHKPLIVPDTRPAAMKSLWLEMVVTPAAEDLPADDQPANTQPANAQPADKPPSDHHNRIIPDATDVDQEEISEYVSSMQHILAPEALVTEDYVQPADPGSCEQAISTENLTTTDVSALCEDLTITDDLAMCETPTSTNNTTSHEKLSADIEAIPRENPIATDVPVPDEDFIATDEPSPCENLIAADEPIPCEGVSIADESIPSEDLSTADGSIACENLAGNDGSTKCEVLTTTDSSAPSEVIVSPDDSGTSFDILSAGETVSIDQVDWSEDASINIAQTRLRCTFSSIEADGTPKQVCGHCFVTFEDPQLWQNTWAQGIGPAIDSRISYLRTRTMKADEGGGVTLLQRDAAYARFSSFVDYTGAYRNMSEVVFCAETREAVASLAFGQGCSSRATTTPTGEDNDPNTSWWLGGPYLLDGSCHISGFVCNAVEPDSAKNAYISQGVGAVRLLPGFDALARASATQEGAAGSTQRDHELLTYVQMRPHRDDPTVISGDVFVLHGHTVVGVWEAVQFKRIPRRVLNVFLPPPRPAPPPPKAKREPKKRKQVRYWTDPPIQYSSDEY